MLKEMEKEHAVFECSSRNYRGKNGINETFQTLNQNIMVF